MNFYIGISLTMLAGVAGMYLLAKTKAESLGLIFKLASWLIILLAGGLIICQVTQGFMRMCRPHHGMMIEKECRMEGMGSMMHHGGDWKEECRRMGCESDDEMECCRYMMGKEKECCKGMGKEEMEHCKGMMKEEEKTDTVKKH